MAPRRNFHQILKSFTITGLKPEGDRRSIRRRRRTLFNLLSAADHANLAPPADRHNAAEMPGGRTTLFNVIQEEEAAAGTLPEREQGRPMRVSLMTLFALGEKLQGDEPSTAGDVVGGRAEVAPTVDEEEAVPAEESMLCCVCMVRRKGAAFVPCGHTFCRLCSRALVTARRSCPVCNEGIMDVLDIF